MGRRFITARDIDDLCDRGESELRVEPSTVLTDLARERARERGLTVTAGGTGVAPAEARRAATATASSDPGDDGVTRRQLRAAVRAAVIAEFGTTPEGIDAAIGRVFDRFEVGD
jgi:hypothetical protein